MVAAVPTRTLAVPGPTLAVVGPTATGKSALALELAERYGGEIVNADALQVYRGLDVGTAKPTAGERARVPHHLLDVVEPTERFSAGDFARRARAALAEIHGRGRLALVVGGSGFYLRALFAGLSPLPRADPRLRRELRRRARDEGPETLHAELARVDPEAASRLAPADVQRVVRALEIVRVGGRPWGEQTADRPLGHDPLPGVWIGLTLPRTVLYDRIEARVGHMLERGWVAEVEGLLARGVGRDAPAFQAIGYRQLVRQLRGELALESAVAEIVQATRRFAKRQITWFRKEPQVRWFDARELASVFDVLERGARVDLQS